MKRFQELNSKIIDWKKKAENCLENLKEILTGNLSLNSMENGIEHEEYKLNEIQSNHLIVNKLLHEPFRFCNIKLVQDQINIIQQIQKDCNEIIEIIKEKIRKLNIQKENIQKILQKSLKEITNINNNLQHNNNSNNIKESVQLNDLKNYENELICLLKEIENCEKISKELLQQSNDDEIEEMLNKCSNLKDETKCLYDAVGTSKKDFCQRISKQYSKAKEEQNRWISDTLSKLKSTKYQIAESSNIEQDFQVVNDLISSIETGERLTDEVIVQSNVYSQMASPNTFFDEPYNNPEKEVLHNNFQSVVSEIFKQKSQLEIVLNETNQQKDILNTIDNNFHNNLSKLSNINKHEIADFDSEKIDFKNVENIEQNNNDDLEILLKLKSNVKDVVVKNNLNELSNSLKEFDYKIQENKNSMMKKMKIHETLLNDLENIRKQTKLKLDQMKSFGQSFTVIDSNYVLQMKQKSKELENVIEDTLTNQSQCLKNFENIYYDKRFPDDVNSKLNSIQTNIQQLNKQLLSIEEEYKSCESDLNEWNDQYMESRELITQLEHSINDESRSSKDIYEKEQKYNFSLTNKDHLELFKENIQRLETLSNHLKANQYQTQLDEIKSRHKQLVRNNSDNISILRKQLQHHREYNTTFAAIKSAIDSFTIDNLEEIKGKSLKYVKMKIKSQKSKLIELNKELKKLKMEKENLLKETKDDGKQLINDEYYELNEKYKNQNQNCDKDLERLEIQKKSLENGEKSLQHLRKWINEKRKLLSNSISWSSDCDNIKKKISEIHNLNLELGTKFDLLTEIERTCNFPFLEANELDFNKHEIKIELKELRDSLEKFLDEGKTVQNLTLLSQEHLKLLTDGHENIKTKINRLQMISNLEIEIENSLNLSNEICGLDTAIKDLKETLWRISQFELGIEISRLLMLDFEKIELNQNAFKNQIKDRLDRSEEKQKLVNVFKTHLKLLNDSIDEILMNYNCIDEKETPANRLEKQEELLSKVIHIKPEIDELRSLADDSGYNTCRDSANNMIAQYDRLLQNIKKDVAFSHDQHEICSNYVNAVDDIANQINEKNDLINEICTRNFAGIDNVTKSKLQALELRKQISKNQDQLVRLNQRFDHKINAFLRNLNLIQSTRELSIKLDNKLKDLNEFIDKCDLELDAASQYNKKINELDNFISSINSNLIDLEKSGDFNESNKKKIKDLKTKILENESMLEEVKCMADSSSLLARSPRFKVDINKFQNKLSEINEQSDRLFEKFNKQISSRENYLNLEKGFENQIKEIQENIDKIDLKSLELSGIESLKENSKIINDLQGKLGDILQNEIDKRCDRYLEMSSDHRNRTKQIQSIEKRIHEFQLKFNQQSENILKFNISKKSIDENIKQLESQFQSITKPDDLVFLQNNEMILRTILFQCEEIELRLNDLKNENQNKQNLLNSKNFNESSNKTYRNIDSLINTIQANLKDYKTTIEELKEHQHLIHSAKTFLKQSQGKLSKSFIASDNIHQIENELQRINNLLESLNNNSFLVLDCTKLNQSKLPCLSNNGMDMIQHEIDEVDCLFHELKRKAEESKDLLMKTLKETKENYNKEDKIKQWLRKEDRKMKLNEQITDEAQIEEEIKNLQNLMAAVISKQEEIIFISNSNNENSDPVYSNVKEMCGIFMDNIKKKIQLLEQISQEFKSYNKLVMNWKNWYEKTIVKRKQIQTMPDSNMRDFIKYLLNEKSEKFDIILSISSNGEHLLPYMAASGREKIKSKINIVKNQWHEMFDDLSILLEILEEKIKKIDSITEKYENCRNQFDVINGILLEEIEEQDPIKIDFQIGLENKDRQLQRFSELKQQFIVLSNGIQQLESTLESNIDNILTDEIADLIKAFSYSKETLDKAKDLSLRSYQNHQIFENNFLQVHDLITMTNKKISLCENLDGTTNSIEGRMERIQELINTDHQVNAALNQLNRALNNIIGTSSNAEQKSFNERYEAIFKEKLISNEHLQSIRLSMESAYKDLENFKSKHDTLQHEISNFQQETQQNNCCREEILNNLTEKSKALAKQLKELHNLGLEIFQKSKNQYPLDLCRSIENQFDDLLKILEKYRLDFEQSINLQNQFDIDEKTFNKSFESIELKLNMIQEQFAECYDLKTCSSIGLKFNEIDLEKQEFDLILDSLKSISQKITKKFPEKFNKIKSRFGKLKQNHEKYFHKLNGIKSQFELIFGKSKEINHKLIDLQSEFEFLDLSKIDELPNEKIKKFNLINEFNEIKNRLLSIKDRINEINVKIISHKLLCDNYEKMKIEISNSLGKSINKINTQLKNVNKSLINQEQLESFINTTKESLHCIESSKTIMFVESSFDKISIEEKIKEIDKDLSVLSSIKKSIDENCVSIMPGCLNEINYLKILQKERDRLEIDLKNHKTKINNDLLYWIELEEIIYRLTKRKCDFDEEINNLSEYGISIANKKAILNKSIELKKEINEMEMKIDEIMEKLISKSFNSFPTEKLIDSIKQLEIENHEQKEKIEKIIDHHNLSISYEEKFENLYNDIMKEILKEKNHLQPFQFNSNSNEFPDLIDLYDSIIKLNDFGFECEKFSSINGKELINKKLNFIEKSWKKLESLYSELKMKKEKENFEIQEFNSQRKKLLEYLENIGNNFHSLQRNKPGNILEIKKKNYDLKIVENEMKEWKTEMDKHFDLMKDVKSENTGMEIAKQFRKLHEEINFEISEMKSALNLNLEFDLKVDEFRKWLSEIDNKISSVSKFDSSTEQITEQIKESFVILSQLSDGDFKLAFIKSCGDNLSHYLSYKGQAVIKKLLMSNNENFQQIQEKLKDKLNRLEMERNCYQDYESMLKEFEVWLSEKEELFTINSLLSTLTEKQINLEKSQNNLQIIYEQKIYLDDIIEKAKKFPLNFSLTHNIKGIQIRYSALVKFAQNRVEIQAKWFETHEKYEIIQQKFTNQIRDFEVKLKTLIEKKKHISNIMEIIDGFKSLDEEITKIEDFKSNFEVYFTKVIGETNEIGKKELSNVHFNLIKTFDNVLNSYNNFKSLISSENHKENQLKKSMEHLSISLDSFNQITINYNPSSQIHIGSLQTCLDGINQFFDELEQKVSYFNQTLTDYKTERSDIINEITETIKTKLKSSSENLSEKKDFIKLLLECNHIYRDSLDKFDQWFENMNKTVQSSSDLKGSQETIEQRWEKMKTVTMSILSIGKKLLDEISENAAELCKNISDKNNKQKIIDQVANYQTAYYNLTKKADNIQIELNDILSQWKNFETNIKCLNKVIKGFANRKDRFKSTKITYSLNIDSEIENLSEFLSEIQQEKSNLEICANQIQTLVEISRESQIEVIFQDLLDQIDVHEIDCKSQIDLMTKIGNEKMAFDRQLQSTQEMINNMKTNLLPLDQLHDVGSVNQYQNYFHQFQMLESKVIDGDRMIDECQQISFKISSLFESEKSIQEIIILLKKNWNNYKDDFDQVKNRMNRLLNLWSNLENLRAPIESWITTSNETIETLTNNGYQSSEMNSKAIQKIKAIRLESEILKPKLSKFIELFYKAEAYQGFSKSKDPLLLQKIFCETLDKLAKLEKSLIYNQTNVDKLWRELLEAEKWIIEMSLFVNSEFLKVSNVNNLIDLKNQEKICKTIKVQIEKFEEGTINILTKNVDEISKLFVKPCSLKNDVFGKLVTLDRGMKQIVLLTEKLKSTIKERSNTVKRFKNIIEKVENLLYKELPEWWNGNEITVTMNPDNCISQISNISEILEKIKNSEMDFEQVWQDKVRQKQSNQTKSSEVDDSNTISGESFLSQSLDLTIIFDDHLYRIKCDLKESKDRIQKKIIELKIHKQKWDRIETEVSELLGVFNNKRLSLKEIPNNQKDDDTFYEEFEKSLIESIEKKDNLDKLNHQIRELNGNKTPKYDEYLKLSESYSDLLYEMESIRKSLRAMDVHDLYQKIMTGVPLNDFSQNVNKHELLSLYPQTGTQTNRNKSTSMQTIKRFSSNPNLNSIPKEKLSQTVNDWVDSSINFGSKSPQFSQKLIQTVNDVGVQSYRTPKSSEKSKSLNKLQQKEKRFQRLNDLLATVRQIKEEIALSNSLSIKSSRSQAAKSGNSLRNSTESIRHNLLQSKPKRKNSPRKTSQVRKSVESLGKRPSPTGCTSPNSFHKESPRKPINSPRKSPTKINTKQRQFAI